MDCEICGRLPSKKLPFKCMTCARNAIYIPRVEHATMLLNKEVMRRRVEVVVQGPKDGAPRERFSLSGAMVDMHDCAKAHEVTKMTAEARKLDERIAIISEKSRKLNLEMEEHKKVIATRKAELLQRRSDMESAKFGLEAREAKELEVVQAGIRRMNRRRDLKQQDIINGRISLCKEAGKLAGLRRVKKTKQDASVREFFLIGDKLPIFRLTELHTAPPEVLTASLTQIAYLTVRTSTYLGLRLPAEITLPHRGYPLPTIFAPASSYLSRNVPFPGTTSLHSSSNSPSASRTLEQRRLPHPRTLFLHNAMANLAKEEPAAYSLFVEGVTLLAWDVVWLCKISGMSGLNVEKDLFHLGRNLWNLLLLEANSTPASKGSPARNDSNVALSEIAGPTPAHWPTRFGHLSHGTTLAFLGTMEGSNILRSWPLKNPASALDLLKSYLRSEMQKAEWEIVEETEWHGQVIEPEDEAVLVGQYSAKERNASRTSGPVPLVVESEAKKAARCESHDGNESVRTTLSAKTQGATGWTKVRTRNPEAPPSS